MASISTWKIWIVCSAVASSCVLLGCSLGSDGLTEPAPTAALQRQAEQMRRDNQQLAGFDGGLAHSLQPSVYAATSDDTLANLLPGGEAVFSALSAALRRDNLGANRGATHVDLGSAYVKSVAGDGEGGLHFVFVVDGTESAVHFSADQYHAAGFFQGLSEGSLTAYSIGSWTDSFDTDTDDPSATDLTDGSSMYAYVDLNAWGIGSVNYIGLRGFSAYGVRTLPENLTAHASYAGPVWAEWWDANNPRSSGQTLLRGTLHLQANLDGKEISGQIDALRIRHPDTSVFTELPDGSSIDIASTPFDEARFTADWVGRDPRQTATPRDAIRGFEGTILGEFYGPAAQEVGGVVSGYRDATETTPEQFLIGGFIGSQPDPGQ